MRILIADDHPLYREAIRRRLEKSYPQVEIIELYDLSDPAPGDAGEIGKLDLVLLDYHMPGVSDEAGVQRAIARFQGSPTIMISGLARREDVKAAIGAGARGYIEKTMPADQFDHALSIVLHGGTYLPAQMIFGSEEEEGRASALDPKLAHRLKAQLTPREMAVLRALAPGTSNKEIARSLKLAEVTIKLHLRQIFRKIGVQNRSQAAVLVSRAGWASGAAYSQSPESP